MRRPGQDIGPTNDDDPRKTSTAYGEGFVRLFVSSTFRDMEAERSILRGKVFPILREHCQRKGIGFYEIDLRWGITQDEAESGRVLEICLEEVDRCRPFFLGLLGGRYGWVDPRTADIVSARDRWRSLLPFADCSITELEFRHAITDRPPDTPAPEAFIYTRPAFRQPGEGRRYARLIDDLAVHGVTPRDGAEDLDAFAGQVLNDMLASLDARVPHDGQPSVRREQARLAGLERQLGASFVETDSFRKLCRYIEAGHPRLALVGAAGSGKTVLAAALSRRLRQASQAFTILSSLRPGAWSSWAEAFSAILLQADEIARPNPLEDHQTSLRRATGAAAERGPVLLVLDGIVDDNLSGQSGPAWLPEPMDGVVQVASFRDDPRLVSTLRGAGWAVVDVIGLTEGDLAAFAAQGLAAFGRRLDTRQTQVLTARPRLALEFSILLEDVRSLPRFEDLDADLACITRPVGLEDVARASLARVARALGDMVAPILEPLALSLTPLNERLLKRLAGTDDHDLPDLFFAELKQSLQGIVSFSPDLIEFRTSSLKSIILDSGLIDLHGAELRLSAALWTCLDIPGAAEEIAARALRTSDWSGLAWLLATPVAVEGLARRAPQSLRGLWTRLRQAQPSRTPALYAAWSKSVSPDTLARLARLCLDLGVMHVAAELARAVCDSQDGRGTAAAAEARAILADLAELAGELDEAERQLTDMLADIASIGSPAAFSAATARQARLAVLRKGPAAMLPTLANLETQIGAGASLHTKAVAADLRAMIDLRSDRLAAAEQGYRQVLKSADQLRDLRLLIAARTGLAGVARLRGRMRDACALLADAERHARILGDPLPLQDILGLRAKLAIETYRYDDALHAIDERAALTSAMSDHLGDLENEVDRARLFAHIGDVAEARRSMTEIRRRATKLGLDHFLAGNLRDA